jgi:hypothetical protein
MPRLSTPIAAGGIAGSRARDVVGLGHRTLDYSSTSQVKSGGSRCFVHSPVELGNMATMD